MEHLYKIWRTFDEYADLPILIEGVGAEILASDVVVSVVYQCRFRMDDRFLGSPYIDSFAFEECYGLGIGFHFRRIGHADSHRNSACCLL